MSDGTVRAALDRLTDAITPLEKCGLAMQRIAIVLGEERLLAILAIVDALAKVDPTDYEGTTRWCIYCDEYAVPNFDSPVDHDPDCLWLRAVEATR